MGSSRLIPAWLGNPSASSRGFQVGEVAGPGLEGRPLLSHVAVTVIDPRDGGAVPHGVPKEMTDDETPYPVPAGQGRSA